MVPPDSCRISPVPHYSGYSSTNSSFTYGPFTLCGAAFQAASIHLRRSCDKSYYPRACKHALVWAVSRSLATTWEITVVFSSFRYLDVSVPGVCPTPMAWYPDKIGMGCPIRTPADQRFFAAPRGFSQLSTSFIASVCLGIHRTPFST